MKIATSTALTLLAACATTPTGPSPDAVVQGCDALTFDLEDGRLNGLEPNVSQERVKSVLPCFTGDTEDGSAFNYGGGVFFIEHDFYFYTGRDFIEVRDGFRGQVSPAMLGRPIGDAQAHFGPARGTTNLPGAHFFATAYGCLRVEERSGVVREVAAHLQSCDEVTAWYRR